MLAFPNAKINLGLYVVSKRKGGYHDLSSCLVPIGWHDVLEIIPSESFGFTTSGLAIPGKPSDNLCVKAYEFLKAAYDLPPIQVHLHKIIPMGAGLGGGSSDGAFMLKMLNEQFVLGLSQETLIGFARRLGADCPFFIPNRPKIVKHAGDTMENASLDMSSDIQIVVVFPNIHLNTKSLFSKITPACPSVALKDSLRQSQIAWLAHVTNHFEKIVFKSYPQIKTIKEDLLHQGAIYASMTGTGSAVYGLFTAKTPLAQVKEKFQRYTVWIGHPFGE